MVGHLAAAIGLDDRNAVIDTRPFGALPKGVDRRMFEQPDLVRSGLVSARGEDAHRLERRQIVDPPELLDQNFLDQRHTTITTEGSSHNSRYSASSWSREVARTMQVRLSYRT